MKKLIPAIFAGVLFALSSHASVSITFSNDLQGFSTLGLTGSGSVAWAASNGTINGGSMSLINDSTSATYHPDMVRYKIEKNPALWNELLRAQANGGFLEYDVVIRNIDQDSTAGAYIFVICTSANELGDNWVNQNAFTTIPMGGNGRKTIHVLMSITTNAAAAVGNFVVNPAATNAWLDFGINSDLTTNSLYIDNVKITAFNPISAADITFDTNLQGFVSQWGGGTFGWSPVNGGSMGLTNGNNWVGDMVQLPIQNNSGMWSNLNAAIARGGILSFTTILVSNSVALGFYSPNDSWLQSSITAASPLDWVNDNEGGGNVYTCDASGQQIASVSMPIKTSGGSQTGAFVVSAGQNACNLEIGMNSGGAINSAVLYIDNIRITPEPAPTITSTVSGSNLTLNWNYGGYKLQTRPSLSSGTWADYGLPPGSNSPVTIPAAGAGAFFRLVQDNNYYP